MEKSLLIKGLLKIFSFRQETKRESEMVTEIVARSDVETEEIVKNRPTPKVNKVGLNRKYFDI